MENNNNSNNKRYHMKYRLGKRKNLITTIIEIINY